jgi:phosphoribosylformylglycinamidine cyclo-ligase
VDAVVDPGKWETPRVFAEIQRLGQISDEEMRRVFNLGIGMVLVVPPEEVSKSLDLLRTGGVGAAEIGRVEPGEGNVAFR